MTLLNQARPVAVQPAAPCTVQLAQMHVSCISISSMYVRIRHVSVGFVRASMYTTILLTSQCYHDDRVTDTYLSLPYLLVLEALGS